MLRFAALISIGFGGTVAAAAELPRSIADDDYFPVRMEEVRLGQLLFYDPILSGNKTVSCATCHHPAFGTSDGLSLGLGDGGIGLGPERRADPENLPEQRVPRNSPALFNLGIRDLASLFHDGRIEKDESRQSGFRTPLDDQMVSGFASLLSAQSMFPVLSPDEMAGHYGENEVSLLVRQGRLTGSDGAWEALAKRVADNSSYSADFKAVYPHIQQGAVINFTDISNAIAAFVEFEWRSDTSPFDAYLAGEARLSPQAMAGLELFYGKAECSTCHAGPFFSDQAFHAMGAVQIGPGKAARFESHARDLGRAHVTGREEDAYAFRTPGLRNVTLTSPYGHAGAHGALDEFLAHHVGAEFEYTPSGVVLPALDVKDWRILESPEELAAIQAKRVKTVPLRAEEIDRIIAFLQTLEDPIAKEGRLGIPETVPSGLPVDRGPL